MKKRLIAIICAVAVIFSGVANFTYRRTHAYESQVIPSEGTNRLEKVIVSLASYPPKYDVLPYALKTLANQTVKPDKIILNLYKHENTAKDKQKIIKILKDNNLEGVITVNWIEERIRSYAKLIPTLKAYPDDIIITADDDWEYSPNFVKDLLEKHKQFPDCIIANCCKRFGNMCPVLNNKYLQYPPINTPIDLAYIFSGFGMLCKKSFFTEKIFNAELFMKEFSTTDDIWYTFCACLSGTKIVALHNHYGDYAKKIAIHAKEKHGFFNMPALASENLSHGNYIGNNEKNLKKVQKMFKDMGITVQYLKTKQVKNTHKFKLRRAS